MLLNALKKTSFMALPVVGSRLTNMIGGFVGMLFIARLGHNELAAGALVNGTLMSIMVTAWSFMFGVSILVGQNYGARRYEDIGVIVRQTFWIGIILAIPVTIIMWNIKPILLFFGQDRVLTELTASYCRAYSFGVLPGFWCTGLMQFVVGISRQRWIIPWSLLGIVIMLFFGYGLLFGKFGLPQLGMAGMGYAITINFWSGLLLISLQIAFMKEFRHYKIFSWHRFFDWHYLKELISFGWPISAQIGAEFTAFAAATILIGWCGVASLAAYQIVMQVTVLFFMVPYGIAQVNTVLISQAVGSCDFAEVRVLGRASFILGAAFMALAGLIYIIWPKFIMSFYLDINNPANSETMRITILLFVVSALLQVIDALRCLGVSSLRGLRDNIVPMWLSIASCLVSLPVAYVLAFYLHLNAPGVRLGFLVSFILGAWIVLRRFHRLSAVEVLSTMKQSGS